ncbi:hypothetical protein [Candidatus Similichlamydia laticola]|uniref:hypothetical protein n=1 Tax=Candidatus Similichlamydia laticola TaxID=2170265 RepID=UPI000DF860BB|nr:hypothetical protein [Candidatus Similichlamydia laticola]
MMTRAAVKSKKKLIAIHMYVHIRVILSLLRLRLASILELVRIIPGNCCRGLIVSGPPRGPRGGGPPRPEATWPTASTTVITELELLDVPDALDDPPGEGGGV